MSSLCFLKKFRSEEGCGEKDLSFSLSRGKVVETFPKKRRVSETPLLLEVQQL